MASSDIRREDVLKTIAKYDELGQDDFLKQYNFGEASQYRVAYDGKLYDSKAIAGVAHGFATGIFWTKTKTNGDRSWRCRNDPRRARFLRRQNGPVVSDREHQGRPFARQTDVEVRRFDIVGGLTEEMYAASTDDAFVGSAVDMVAKVIGREPAFPELLEKLGLQELHTPAPVEGSSEVSDAIDVVDEISNPRKPGYGRRRSAAENKATEEHAVRVVRDHFEGVLGYSTVDVGLTEPYDVHATKGDSVIKIEVKGTTSDGAAVVLTSNEVKLHRAGYPNNALAVVRRIVLDTSASGEAPVAAGGELVLTMPWTVEEQRLDPIAYRYDTGM
jgi:hypothetical protein